MENKDIYKKNGFVSIDEILKEDKKYNTKSSLEDIVQEERVKPVPASDEILKEILTGKVKFLKQLLNEIDTQIRARDSLKETILNKIDNRLCKLKSKTYDIESWGIGNNKNIDSRRSQLEKEIEALVKQKSDEERENWRDVALLRKEHRQFSQQYLNAMRRVKIITGQQDEN